MASYRHTLLLLAAASLAACSTVKYEALEQVGVYKRDILVDRVEDARDSQSETREELLAAYEELNILIGEEGGELERQYKRLDRKVERSKDAIEELDDHLAAIDEVSADLFEEWEEELAQYNSAALRADQEQKLRESRRQFTSLRQRMQVARDRVDPVMAVLNDNVLYLKHSLNARALDALRGEATALEGKVDALIADMQVAIDEANAFINRMRES
jgi:chromosome segregation ATPase